MAYDNTNSGALFANTTKVEGDKRPDYKGMIDVNGVTYQIAGWVREMKKEGREGEKFLSLKIELPKPKTGGPAIKSGDIPF